MGHELSCKSKWGLGHKRAHFLLFSRVREERNRRAKSLLPRSMEFRQLKFIRPITKVHCIDEGYAWVPKIRDFIEDPNEEFGKSKVSGLGSVHEAL